MHVSLLYPTDNQYISLSRRPIYFNRETIFFGIENRLITWFWGTANDQQQIT